MTVSLSQHATSLTDSEIVEQSDLGSITHVTADGSRRHARHLPNFPFTKVDPLIVTRNNPVDEDAMGKS